MKILVTGGAGFIGSNFIRYKLNSDSSVKIINLDKLTYAGNPDNLKDLEDNDNYKLIKGDIADESIVSQIMENEKPDAVINFAAESHVDNSIKNSLNFTKTNVLGTNVLLNVSKFYNIDRFIQISTDEVYGSAKKGKFREKDPLKPNNPYSASKTAADVLVRSYIKTYNFPALITRSCNNVGPYQHVEKFIPLFTTNLFEEKKVPLYGDGSNIREWIHVLDNCKGIDTVLKKGKIGEIYNIGTGEEKSNLEIAKLLQEKIQPNKELIKFVTDRKGHDFRYALDNSKIRNLGWQPEFKFSDAFENTINSYKNNKWWWKKLK